MTSSHDALAIALGQSILPRFNRDLGRKIPKAKAPRTRLMGPSNSVPADSRARDLASYADYIEGYPDR